MKFNFKGKLSASFLTFMLASCAIYASAFASTPDPSKAFEQVGITSGSVSEGAGSLFSDIQNVIYIVMAIGGFWGIIWIIIGAMLLTGSGGNPQKRNQGIAALLTAAIGIFVIYKAYDIASWAVGLGGTGQ